MDKNFTIEDRFKLDKITFKPMKDYFASRLSSDEKKIVDQIEIYNIYRLYPIVFSIFTAADLTSIITDIDKRRKLSLLLEDIETDCLKTGLDKETVSFFTFSASTVWLFSYYLTNGMKSKLEIIGKVPPKGIFSKRQELANEWFINYVTNITKNINSLYLDCKYSKEMILPHFVSNTVYYLIKNMPHKFSRKENETDNDMVYRIFQEFLLIAKHA